MNRRILFFMALILALSSCKNDEGKAKEASAEVPEAHNIPSADQHFSDYFFFKTLEGTIAGKPVVMNIIKAGDRVDANYYYKEKGQPIFLVRDWERTNPDSLNFLEITNPTSDISNRLSLKISEEGINGIWSDGSKPKSFPIVLKEIPQNTGLQLVATGAIDSAKYMKFKTDTPTLQSAVTVVAATGNNAEWFNNQLKNIIGANNKKYAALSLPQTAKAIVEGYVKGYNSDVDSSLVGIDDKGPHYFLNREYETLCNIIFNSNGYVVSSIFDYAFTGGAHGNYGTSMYCFDVNQQKRLLLTDIVKIDSVTIQKLLEQSYRKQYRVPQNTPLDQRLFVKSIQPNDNFYFAAGGLGFRYTPYEIASYADGEINLWIPFSEIKAYLNPEFAKRMNL